MDIGQARDLGLGLEDVEVDEISLAVEPVLESFQMSVLLVSLLGRTSRVETKKSSEICLHHI